MNEFMFDGKAGRDHLQDLINEAEQERLARSVSKAQGNSLTRTLRKALDSILR